MTSEEVNATKNVSLSDGINEHVTSVLHQNKDLYNFHKRVQYSIVKHNKGLEYAIALTATQ